MAKTAQKTLTVGDLPPDPKGRDLPGGGYVEPVRPKLVCSAGCYGEYSANPGDYFMAGPTTPLACGECGASMRVVRKVTRYEQW